MGYIIHKGIQEWSSNRNDAIQSRGNSKTTQALVDIRLTLLENQPQYKNQLMSFLDYYTVLMLKCLSWNSAYIIIQLQINMHTYGDKVLGLLACQNLSEKVRYLSCYMHFIHMLHLQLCICTSFMKYTHPETDIQWLQPIKKLILGVNLYSRIWWHMNIHEQETQNGWQLQIQPK